MTIYILAVMVTLLCIVTFFAVIRTVRAERDSERFQDIAEKQDISIKKSTKLILELTEQRDKQGEIAHLEYILYNRDLEIKRLKANQQEVKSHG